MSRPLGARQISVLRAAAAGELVRYDDGGWAIKAHACTDAARSVARRNLLQDGARMATLTLGAGTRHGRYVGLNTDGERALKAWELDDLGTLINETKRAEAIRRLAAKPGPITFADLRGLVVADESLPGEVRDTLLRFLRDDEEQP